MVDAFKDALQRSLLYVNGLRLPTARERQAFFSYMRPYRDRIPITSFERLPFQLHRVGNPARGFDLALAGEPGCSFLT